MAEFTAEEFADSVRASISTVNHLGRQVDRLNASLRDALTGEPHALAVLCATLPAPGKGRNDLQALRFDHGLLYHADAADSEEEMDDEDDFLEEPEVGDEAASSRRKRHPVELMPDQPVLAVRTLLYNPKNPEELEPQILYGVLTDWRVGDKLSKPSTAQPFRLKSYMAIRILRAIDHRTGISAGDRLRTKAIVIGKGRAGPRNPERELSAQLAGPLQSIRLYDLDGVGTVEQLAADIKAHWRAVTTDTTTSATE